MDGLRATIKKSKERPKNNDVSAPILHSVNLQLNPQFSPTGSSPEEMRKEKPSSGRKVKCFRKSTDMWEAALALAQACCEKFDEPVTNVEEIERNGNDALALLTQR